MTHQAILGRPYKPSATFFILVAAWIVLLWIFYAIPALDLRISSLFFTGPGCTVKLQDLACGYFPLRSLKPVTALRWALYYLPHIAFAIIILAIIGGLLVRQVRERLPLARLVLAIASLGLSTGLIVNLFLKSFSGRPRPFQTIFFGGPMEFVPAGSFSGECTRNCSFVSGEASSAGWLLCLLFLLPPDHRRWLGPPIIVASVTTAFLRVAVGSHFASDVLLGWLLSIVVFQGLLTAQESWGSARFPSLR
jgi:membrane-associated phospholipid phosphatase